MSDLGNMFPEWYMNPKADKKVATIDTVSVLDHGFVRLISSMGDDLAVVRNARNSHDAAWRAGSDAGSDRRLINYLWKNAHSTPFEAVTFTFEVKAPIFVFRQWHRHRVWAFNELSARYTKLPEEYYLPDPNKIGAQSAINKQARDTGAALSKVELDSRIAGVERLKAHCEAAFVLYRQQLEDGWPRELARLGLPLNTYSKMFATVNLLNLLRFLTLRDDSHAQYEIQVYARALRMLILPIVPETIAAYDAGKAKKE